MKWISIKSENPKVATDKIARMSEESDRLLLWIDTYGAMFGKYYLKSGRYGTEGLSGVHQDRITHFAYIEEPTK